MEFTLNERRMKRSDLGELVSCYNPENRNQRKATQRAAPSAARDASF